MNDDKRLLEKSQEWFLLTQTFTLKGKQDVFGDHFLLL